MPQQRFRIRPAVLFALLLPVALGQAQAQQSNDGEWPMAARDYASTRYSALNQITPANVRNLKVAFTFSTGVDRGQEAAPIVVGNTMYVVAPYPNYLYALDLTRPGAPMKWKFEPNPDARSQGVACCDVVNRGVAYSEGRIFMNTLDGQTIAVDAGSGKEVWRTKLGDIKKGETITMAPLVVKDKVLVGNSGGEFGVRGWLVALDARSGKEAWRAWSTGPDSE
jgi:glucose dehydrogenase